MKPNTLTDLRKYTGESGGTHGLDDVSKGNVYLDEVFGLPHCKYHGAMLKVAPDGIWRCGITDAFQVTKIKDRSEIAISHGCYFDNVAPKRCFVENANYYEHNDSYGVIGTLLFVPNSDIRKIPSLKIPIVISETEKIVIGDWVQLLDSFGYPFLGGPQQWIGNGVLNDGHRKVLVRSEQFSNDMLQTLIDNNVNSGEKVVVKCISHIFELDPSWGGGYEIDIQNGCANISFLNN